MQQFVADEWKRAGKGAGGRSVGPIGGAQLERLQTGFWPHAQDTMEMATGSERFEACRTRVDVDAVAAPAERLSPATHPPPGTPLRPTPPP